MSNLERRLVVYERYVTVHDSRVCVHCSAWEGAVFPAGEGPYPPRHPGCRCERVFDHSEWIEVDVEPDPVPAPAAPPAAEPAPAPALPVDQIPVPPPVLPPVVPIPPIVIIVGDPDPDPDEDE